MPTTAALLIFLIKDFKNFVSEISFKDSGFLQEYRQALFSFQVIKSFKMKTHLFSFAYSAGLLSGPPMLKAKEKIT